MNWKMAYQNLCTIEGMVKNVIMGDHSEYADFSDCWEKMHEIKQLLEEWDSERGEELKHRLIREAMEDTEGERD